MEGPANTNNAFTFLGKAKIEHKCVICEKVYKTKVNLKNHYNQHHNNSGKLFFCNICTKSFQTERNLEFHNRSSHGGIRGNYSCQSCGKSFSST